MCQLNPNAIATASRRDLRSSHSRRARIIQELPLKITDPCGACKENLSSLTINCALNN